MLKMSSTSVIWMGSKQLFVSGHEHTQLIDKFVYCLEPRWPLKSNHHWPPFVCHVIWAVFATRNTRTFVRSKDSEPFVRRTSWMKKRAYGRILTFGTAQSNTLIFCKRRNRKSIGIIRLNRKAPMYKCGIVNYFITKNRGCKPGDECAKPLLLFKQVAVPPFPQSSIAAAEWFTKFYNGFIEDKFCERPRCDILYYTLFPELDIDKFLGCPRSELLCERFDFSKESLLTLRKYLRANCRLFADILKLFFLMWTLMCCDQTFTEFCFHGCN